MSTPTTARQTTHPRHDLHHYLVAARRSILWKLDGLDEYDLRRPLTPSGTNLLGLVRHLTGVELLYLGICFDRYPADPPSWFGQEMPVRSDFIAPAEVSKDSVIGDYRGACDHADAVLASLPDSATAHAPWLSPEPLGLHRILLHVVTETEHHAGHADIVRELVDSSIGRGPDDAELDNTGGGDVPDADGWRRHHDRVEAAATAAAALHGVPR